MKNLKILKKILSFFKPFYKALTISLILVAIITAAELSSGFFMGKVVDAFIGNENRIIFMWMSVFFFVYVFQTILQRIQVIYEINNFDFELGHHVSNVSLAKTFQLSLGQIKREHSGFKQSVLNKGKNSISNLIYMCVYELLPLLVQMILAFIGIALLDVSFLPILAIFAIVYTLVNFYVNQKMYVPMKRLTDQGVGIEKTLSDVLRNLFFVKFSNQQDKSIQQIKDLQNHHIQDGKKVWKKYNIDAFFMSDLLSMVLLGVMVFLLYTKISNGQMTVGSFIPIISWTFAFMYSLARFRRMQRRVVLSLVDVEKMFEMLEQKTDLETCENPRPIKVFEDKISFEHVQFDYQEGKKGALHNINLEIQKGEKVALVGRSGSGKTTIVSLLLRLYDPKSGTILIDGVDLKSLVLEDWHNMIAYVPQDGDLLDISIKENILFGAKHRVTSAEVESVLEKAGIKEFIHNLPHGVDTIVGEKGVKLSGGQKQRVCIARALIKDAPILLLDEATSSLDSETESFVNKAIWDMLGNKTGVVIAHRLSTIIDADKIVVMDGGEIVAIGNHSELLKSSPYYKKLVDAQNVNL